MFPVRVSRVTLVPDGKNPGSGFVPRVVQSAAALPPLKTRDTNVQGELNGDMRIQSTVRGTPTLTSLATGRILALMVLV